MPDKPMLNRTQMVGLVAWCFALASCVSPRAANPMIKTPEAVIQSQVQWHKEYMLAPGDQIEVVVRRFADLTKTLTVRPDGAISLPIVNDVAAAGLTASELSAKLTKLLVPRLVNPEVSVIAVQTRQPMIYVVGDVAAVGAVPFRSAPTAMQAIALTGGLKRSSAARSISIVRLGQDGYLRAIPVTAEVGGQPGPYLALSQIPLEPDDIVFVPENTRSQISRALEDFVNKPLFEANLLLQPYLTFKYVQSIAH
jgi:polysaccharide biosynthesis/export protein